MLIYERVKQAAKVLLFGLGRRRTEIPALTEGEVQEARTFFPRTKFFVFGHARSGTTLLARLLRVHPEVHCNWQAHFFTRQPLVRTLVADDEVRNWLSRRDNRWNRGRDMSTVVLRAICDYVLEREAHQFGKSIVGDKSPNTVYGGKSVQFLHTVYPDAFLLVIVRDGRDTILSHIFQAFIDHPHNLSPSEGRIREKFIDNPTLFYTRSQSLFTEEELTSRTMNWVQNIEETENLGRELYRDRFLQVRYEDILSNPGIEMERIWDFLGAKQGISNLEDTLQKEIVVNPDAQRQLAALPPLAESKRKGGPGLWEEFFTERDRDLFKEIAGETLIRLRYEDDLTW